MATATSTHSREILHPAARFFEAFFSIIFTVLIFSFFLAHQVGQTGFFTAEFGGREMLALYGPLALGLLPPLVRAVTGRRSWSVPFEAIANTAFVIGTLWLLRVFPFSFGHFTDVIPAGFQFMFAWLTDSIARILMVLTSVAVAIAALVNWIKTLSYL